jgi:[acyl-carrier-protein] S-malonyltransferase
MTYAVLCPGQGAQHPGMLDALRDCPSAERVLADFAHILGADPRSWCRPETIFRNDIAQPLICASQLAAWSELRRALPSPAYFAGYSVGELASYACADALDASELAFLARDRSKIMEAALDGRYGGLVAVRGLRRDEIEPLCAGRDLWLAIIVHETSVVLGGTRQAIDDLVSTMRTRHGELKLLNVEIPAHTPLLAAAAAPFRHALDRSRLREPRTPVLSGIDGSVISERTHAINALSEQICNTIDWSRCVDSWYERRCRVFLELGPGAALSRLVRERFSDVEARSIDDFRSLAAAQRWIQSRLI